MKIRVLTYNLHKGFSFLPWLRELRSRPGYIIDKMRAAIRATHADIVFLQEIGGLESPHATECQLEFMADEIWKHFSYGKNAVYQSDRPLHLPPRKSDGNLTRHHGNAILSKFPITFSENINISLNSYEKRGILHCRADLGRGREADLICTHLNLRELDRRKQIQLITQRIARKVSDDAPMILAGDFNDWRRTATSHLKSQLQLHEVAEPKGFLTFPASFPFLSLDRIYYRNLELADAHVTQSKTWGDLSDHLGIIADFQYTAPMPEQAEA